MTSAQESGQSAPNSPPRPTPADIPIATPDPRTRSLPGPGSILTAAAWVVVAGLAVVAVGRLVHLDDLLDWPYAAVNAFTPLLYLPAYAALAVAFARRRNLLLIASVLVIAIHLAWTVPEVLPGTSENAASGSAQLRVMTANLRYSNEQADRLGEQIQTTNPDVLVLIELSPLTLARMEASGALNRYRYREVRAREGGYGAAIYARFELRDVAAPVVGGVFSLRATVRVDERRQFVAYAVHTISPTSGPFTSRWRAQLDDLRRQARQARLPVVMAGDFNATRDHRPLRRLIDAGMRDAHDVAGDGWSPTWSATAELVPPVLRLDHVLASPAFAITGYAVGGEFGSDHLPIIADLAMR